MIATHNIKVNGQWYRAGEELPAEEPKKAEKPVEEIPAETAPATEAEKPKEAPKPRATSTRRKTTR